MKGEGHTGEPGGVSPRCVPGRILVRSRRANGVRFFGAAAGLVLTTVASLVCGCAVVNTILPVGVPSLRPTPPLPEVDRWEVGGVEVTDADDIERMKTVCRPRYWTPEVGTSPGRTLSVVGYLDDERVVTREVLGDRLLRGGYNDLTYAKLSTAEIEWLYRLAGTSEDEIWRNTADYMVESMVGGVADVGEDQQ